MGWPPHCRCGAVIPVGSHFCPACGAPTAPRRRNWLLQTTGGLTVIIVCVGSLLAGGLLLFENLDKLPAAFPQTGYAAHANEIRYGMSMAEVRAICGEPEHTQHMEVGGPESGLDVPRSNSDNFYYDGGYQLVFENDKLTSINRY